MKKTKVSLLVKWFAVILCLAIIAACSNNSNSPNATNAPSNAGNAGEETPDAAASEAPSLPEVELTFIYPVSANPGPDQKLVNDEINKYLKEKINATVDLKPLTFDEYEPKLNAMLAAGENFDLAWSSKGWLGNYQPYIDRGAYLEITEDMIGQYAAEARANIPDKFWPDMLAVDGKVYGFPIYQVAAKTKSLVIQKRFVDKYNLDVSAIQSYKELEPFLKTLKDNEPGIIPLGLAQNSWGLYTDRTKVGEGMVLSYAKDDPTLKYIGSLQTLDEKKSYFDTMRSWYQAGYINDDAPIIQNINDLKSKGNVAVALEFTSKPGGEVGEMAVNGGNEVVYAPISDSYFTGIAGAMHVINKGSKNPERTLMLINLLNTDPYLYNLICNGIEGKHYNKTDDKYIEPIKDSGYAPNGDWVFGNQFNAYLKPGQAADTWERTIALNDSAIVPATSGFGVNEENIKAEIANVTAVNNEYQVALESGSVDPAKELSKYREKLIASGQEKIEKEAAAQWDKFKQEKGLVK
ncbi:ABC transporter substrate-binding protein [Paenibacillus sp. PL91]|uniref:ABC transporter substrate-binding protein n=1 Tax=Paenibacillus sp. PL91 TaxID=2729538 RepID=UPI00145F50E9|nr:ABC transporter substrate-binding protein [Paenibacillus sp. PL91]MBC9201187.1 ABC transporter substrate-binding protein [Paenibacillus sp. PL91]